MLLYFKCRNFKSFRDEFCFNMVPKRTQKLEDSILSRQVNGKEIRALSASLIYGPNGAGKSSVFQAMSCLRQIILRGNIRDPEAGEKVDPACSQLALLPYVFLDYHAPIRFEIGFVTGNIRIDYFLSFYVAGFLQREGSRSVDEEILSVNGIQVFHRTKDLVRQFSLRGTGGYRNADFPTGKTEDVRSAMKKSLAEDSLLLTGGFSSFCSKKIVDEIQNWFRNQLLIINSANFEQAFQAAAASCRQTLQISNEDFNRFLREAGITRNTVRFQYDPVQNKTKLVSAWKQHADHFPLDEDSYEMDDAYCEMDAELIESAGTLRLLKLVPIFLHAMASGAVLAVDGLDTSLHPVTLMNLVAAIHNDDVNAKGAQLIFTAYDSACLNNRLLRRDEIKLVERDKKTDASSMYVLSDFRRNGSMTVSATSDYQKRYLMSEYGALEDVNFLDLFSEILLRHKEGSDQAAD